LNGDETSNCDKHVCVCVRVSVSLCMSVREDISRITGAIFSYFVHAAFRRGCVLLRRGDEIPRKGAISGIFYPTDNALYGPYWGIHFSTNTDLA